MEILNAANEYATLIVGSFAFILYYLKHRSEVKKAATIVLLAIRQAEKVIRATRENRQVHCDNLRLLGGDPWKSHNHLLVNYFDQDELELIDNFFKDCQAIDKFVGQLSTDESILQKCHYIQKHFCDIAYHVAIETKEAVTDSPPNPQDVYLKLKNSYLNLVNQDESVTIPKAPQEKIAARLNDIQMVTTTTAGNRLKNLASRRC